jgi:hypothetical protein
MPATWHLAPGDMSKAIIGTTVLAGPYPHSNALGLAVVLGLPFVLTSLTGIGRVAATSIVVWSLVWSASRASLFTAGVVILATIATGAMGRRSVRNALCAAIAMAGGAMVILPLTVTDPRAYTSRGLIWMSSIRNVPSHLLFCEGPDTYLRADPVTASVGVFTTHGHNIFVTTITEGGVLYVAALFTAVVIAVVAAARSQTPRALLIFVLGFVVLGIIEDPLRLGVLDSDSLGVWLPLAFIAGRAKSRN